VVALGAAPAAAAPAFDDPAPTESHDGTLQLTWAGEPSDYEVELREGDDTRVIYRGRLPSAHVSGLPDGHYALRVREHEAEGWSAWSEPKPVEVRHHPMSLVWTLVGLGAVVFTATAAVVLYSARGVE